MSTTIELKEKIHEFIDQADDRILKIFYAIIKTEEEEDRTELKKRINQARSEKKAGKLKSVNPSDIWNSIK